MGDATGPTPLPAHGLRAGHAPHPFRVPGSAGRDARPLLLFLGLYLLAFLLAGLIAPHLYAGVQWLDAAGVPPQDLWAYLSGHRFSRYVDRLRMVLTLVVVAWLLTRWGFWGRFGFRGFRWRREALWLALGVGTLALVPLAQYLGPQPLELRSEHLLAALPGLLLGAAVTALLIGILEEALFRGFLFRLFATATGTVSAVLLSALVYALVHFKSVDWPREAPVDTAAGLEVAARMAAAAFLTVEVAELLSLFLAGVLLAILFLKTGTLWPCAALHAGWVWVRQAWASGVNLRSDSPGAFWLGTERVTDGYLASCIVLALLIATLLWLPRAAAAGGTEPR